MAFEILWETASRVPSWMSNQVDDEDGQLLETRIVHLPRPAGHAVNSCVIYPSQTFDHKTVAHLFFDCSTPLDKPAAMYLEYNYAVDQLSVR